MKFILPAIIVAVTLLISYLIWTSLELDLDITQVFNSNPTPAPSGNAGLSITLKGVDGDSAQVGFMPTGGDSESAAMTSKTSEQLQKSLGRVDFAQWQSLTNLPTSIFRFNAYLVSATSSPNNSKKVSYFLVTQGSIQTRIAPGGAMELVHDFDLSNLPKLLAGTEIKLGYENGMYMNFFDKNGNFVSQSTGQVQIRTTFFTKILIFFGVWAFVVGALTLAKQTLVSGKDWYDTFSQLK